MTRPLPSHRPAARRARMLGALLVPGLVGASTLGLLALGGPATAADSTTCAAPGVSVGEPSASVSDSTVNVYAGGNFTVRGAAEAEGVVVVGENFRVDKQYNVGVVGVGSQIAPPKNSVMLRVGGDAHGSGQVHVGAGIGGDARVGGTASRTLEWDNFGGELKAGIGRDQALGGTAQIGTTLPQLSKKYAAMADTGTVETTSWGTTTLRGDGKAKPQVFTIDVRTQKDAFGTADQPASLKLDNIPTGASVVVNVRGTGVRTNLASVLGADGSPLPIGSSAFGEVASHTLWNVVDDKSPTFAGSAQWAGSVLVPTAGGTTTVNVPGMNGRTWVAGDLVHTGGGFEFHNYPFVGDEELTCTTTPGPGSSTTPPAGKTPADEPTGPGAQTPTGSATVPGTSESTAPAPADATSPAPVTTTAPASTATAPASRETAAPTGTAAVPGATAQPTASGSLVATSGATPDGPSDGLAQTGASQVAAALAVAGTLLVAGLALLLIRRRRAA